MRQRAFTLIEILVVVTLVALLLAILTPTLHSAMTRSRVLRGGANLQQIAQAAAMHIEERDGALPQLKIGPTGAISDAPNAALGRLLALDWEPYFAEGRHPVVS